KATFFASQPGLLDEPLVVGNLINVTFGNYVFRQPFPNIYRLLTPSINRGSAEEQLQQKIDDFLTIYREESAVDYINDENQEQMATMYTHALLPFYDQIRYSNRLRVGVALEDNFLVVQGLNQFLHDLTFVAAEPYDLNQQENYDVIVSSNQLMKKLKPEKMSYIWDYAADDRQYIDLYRTLKNRFDEKNLSL
ncbi:M protein trans-acting positive regulator, partial [Listeria monocytogenes]|nr:M protein trans-acting positive regulator [Listeria monocytogenes]